MKKGSLLLLAFAIIALCLPVGVSAAPIDDWNISGSVQMDTFKYWSNKDRKASLDSGGILNGLGYPADPWANTYWDLNRYLSLINFSATSGDITAVVEICPAPDAASMVRLFYAKWNFGVGSLLIGQNWTPLNQYYSNQVAENWAAMMGYGALWELRKPMIQVNFPALANLKVAFLKPNTPDIFDESILGNSSESKATLPKVEASVSQGFGPIVVDFSGGYNTYTTRGSANEEITVNSWIVAGGVTANLGPVKASVSGYGGKNVGVILGINEYGNDTPQVDIDGKSLIDATTLGYMAVVSYTVIPQVTLQAGWGQLNTEIDDNSSKMGDVFKKWTVTSYYLQAKIAIAKNVYVTPEVGVIDYGKSLFQSSKDVKLGNKKYAGIQWMMNF